MVIEIKQLMKSINATNYPKRRREHARQGKKGDPLGIVQETKISPYYQKAYVQTRMCSEKYINIFWDFDIQTDHPIQSNPIQKTRDNFNHQEEVNL